MRNRGSNPDWLWLALLSVAIFAGPAAGQDGALDPRLSADGKWTWFTNGMGSLTAAEPLSHGGVAVAGRYQSPYSWHVNGLEFFADQNWPTFDFEDDGAIACLDVEDMMEDSQARIWLAGSCLVGPGAPRPALARITQQVDDEEFWSLALDNSFGGDGRLLGPAPPAGWTLDNINDAIVLADGRSLFTGSCAGCLGAGTHGAFVVRLTAVGAADPAFSGDGWFAFSVQGYSVTQANAIAPASSGAVLVAGQASTPGIVSFVARITSGGALDPAVNNNAVGFYELSPGGTGTPTGVAFDPDTGKAVISRASGFGAAGAALVGFNALGQVDSTFGSSGVLDLDIEEGTRLDAVEFQSDGKIVAAGTIDANGSQPAGYFMARSLANGVLDSTFDGNGVKRVEIDELPEGDDFAHAITLFGGRLVVVGQAENVFDGNPYTNLAAVQLTCALIFTDSFERGTTLTWTSDVP